MTGATIRILPAEEIASRTGGTTPFLLFPPATVFAERAMRLRQRAAGHAMADYLRFVADLALAQHRRLEALTAPVLPLPDAAALDAAAHAGVAPLPAASTLRGHDWHGVLRAIVADLRPTAPDSVRPVLDGLDRAHADDLDAQADTLLLGATAGVDLAQAPPIAAALQVAWTHALLQLPPNAVGRTEDATVCPCCGTRPVASVTRSGGDLMGQRYLQCALCSLQWNVPRATCTHCGSTRRIAYESLDVAGASADETAARAARATVQAETCDDCDHYLKFLHGDRDPMIEAVADDLASLTLDFLVGDAGRRRHGMNLMLLFADAPDADRAAPQTVPAAPDRAPAGR